MDFYHWFDKSSKKKSELKEYYDFYDTDYSEIIEFESPFWLCLEMWVNRGLKKHEGFKSYSLSEACLDEIFKQ